MYSMTWNIEFTRKASGLVAKLNNRAKDSLRLLVKDLLTNGPAPGPGWPNYGKLHGKKTEDKRHCHLIRGETNICLLLGRDQQED